MKKTQITQPLSELATHEEKSGLGQSNTLSQEDGRHDSGATCSQGGTGENQCDQHRTGDATTERENDQCVSRGHGVRSTCDFSSSIPYGRVTTHKVTGQQFFFRWPHPPYLDNASECITVYAAPQPAIQTVPALDPVSARALLVHQRIQSRDPNPYREDDALVQAEPAVRDQLDWTQIGKLLEAVDSARALGFTVGTTNWGAHVYHAVFATAIDK